MCFLKLKRRLLCKEKQKACHTARRWQNRNTGSLPRTVGRDRVFLQHFARCPTQQGPGLWPGLAAAFLHTLGEGANPQTRHLPSGWGEQFVVAGGCCSVRGAATRKPQHSRTACGLHCCLQGSGEMISFKTWLLPLAPKEECGPVVTSITTKHRLLWKAGWLNGCYLRALAQLQLDPCFSTSI